jgi:Cu+-exporting ATPase
MDQGPIGRRDVGITALSCAACVGRVERVVGGLDGVTGVSVNLATERAAIETGPGFDPRTLMSALDRAGYPLAGQSIDLAIDRMECASCIGRVERALLKVPGVRTASVNLATGQARVEVASGLATPEMLIDSVEAAGYGARLAADRATAGPVRDRDGIMALAALLLALPLLLPMLLAPFGVSWMLAPPVQLGLACVVQCVFGARFYRGAWKALQGGTGTMDTLVALGTSAAFALSLWDLAQSPTGPLYFEASAVVIALVRVGKWLEGRARRQAGDAIRALEGLRPETATVRDGGVDRTVAVEALRPGALLVIRPGERIAADSVVRDGEGQSDESLLTGESLPVEKRPGDALVGGALNGASVLLAEVSAVGAESRLAHMVRLVEDAQAAKPPVQRLVDRVSAVFVPLVIGIALATLLGWWWAGAGIGPAIVHAVSVLVIACPCALGLATPAAIMVGTGVAARHGILIRDPGVLEQAGRLRTVVFDKTGTLTQGRPALMAIHVAPDQDETALLRLAARLQSGSEHPLARALLERDAATPGTPGTSLAPGLQAASVRALPGLGLQGVVDGRTIRIGNQALMREAGIDCAPLGDAAAALERDGRTVSFLSADGTLLGLFGFGDAIRPGMDRAIALLRQHGLKVSLLTGDNRGAAEAVGRALGIDDITAGAGPADKAARSAARRALGPVAMVGDGVNDAAALASADLGVALAGGSDVAMASAGITLMRADPMLVPAALDIAAQTMRRIRLGLFWAFAYNLVGIPLAVAGLLTPVVAGAAMAFSSVVVVGSALLLGRWSPEGTR